MGTLIGLIIGILFGFLLICTIRVTARRVGNALRVHRFNKAWKRQQKTASWSANSPTTDEQEKEDLKRNPLGD